MKPVLFLLALLVCVPTHADPTVPVGASPRKWPGHYDISPVRGIVTWSLYPPPPDPGIRTQVRHHAKEKSVWKPSLTVGLHRGTMRFPHFANLRHHTSAELQSSALLFTAVEGPIVIWGGNRHLFSAKTVVLPSSPPLPMEIPTYARPQTSTPAGLKLVASPVVPGAFRSANHLSLPSTPRAVSPYAPIHILGRPFAIPTFDMSNANIYTALGSLRPDIGYRIGPLHFSRR